MRCVRFSSFFHTPCALMGLSSPVDLPLISLTVLLCLNQDAV